MGVTAPSYTSAALSRSAVIAKEPQLMTAFGR